MAPRVAIRKVTEPLLSLQLRRRLVAFLLCSYALGSSCRPETTPPAAATVPPATSGHAALVAALGSRCRVEPRLTGGFRCARGEAAEAPLSREERRALSKAEALIRKERSLHAAGLLALLLGQPEQAVHTLERAASESPRDGPILSDLSAAYLVRAKALDQPLDFVAALDSAERVLEQSPTCLEALFNRALVRQQLSLSSQAAGGWKEYLARENDPEWAEKAKAALSRLPASTGNESWPEAKPRLQQALRRGDQKSVTALVGRFPQDARLLAEEESLVSWAELREQGNLSGSEAELATARAIGRGLVELSGESLLAHSVAGIDQALHGDRRRLHLLIEGFSAYGEGLALIKQRKFSLAEAPISRAERALGRRRVLSRPGPASFSSAVPTSGRTTRRWRRGFTGCSA